MQSSFSEILKRGRKRHGWPREELADRLKVDVRTVRNWE